MTNPITITPELPIGTELWFMLNNKPHLALVAAYKVLVTSCTEEGSWYDQLWARWHNKKAKDTWKYNFYYEVKVDSYIPVYTIDKIKGKWYIMTDRECFLSKEELLKSI